MTDMESALDIERFQQCREVVSVGVHVVPLPGLARAAVAAPVMRDAAVTPQGEEQHLVFPRVPE
jgi:hypothetical protein